MTVPETGSQTPDAAPAQRTSRLAIAAFILALIPVCLNYVGFILGIVAAVRISKNRATQKGMGLAIAAIVIGAIWIPISISMLAAIAIPNFIKFQSRAKQSEAKANLKSLSTALMSYEAQTGAYSDEFGVIGFSPEPGNRYTYYLGSSTHPAMQGEVGSLPPGLETGVSEEGFYAAAVGNIDGDPTFDVWVIDQDGLLENLVDDLHE